MPLAPLSVSRQNLGTGERTHFEWESESFPERMVKLKEQGCVRACVHACALEVVVTVVILVSVAITSV